MSGRGAALIVGILAIAAIAYLAWPAAHDRVASSPDARTAALPRLPVRKPDNVTAPSGLSVRFALRDRKGAPLGGVELTATPEHGAPSSATSGDDGIAALPLGVGRWHLAAAGHAIAGADEVELAAAIDHEVPLRLDPEAEPPPAPEDLGVADRSGGLTGVVTGGGAHLADVTVAPTYLGGYGPGHPVVHDRAPHPIAIPPRRFLGAPSGYTWRDLPPGGYDLFVSSPGWGTTHVRANVEPTGFGVGSVALLPAASVSGAVQDGRGAPVSGAIVHAEVDGRTIDQALTGADGIYLLDELPAGVITLAARFPKDICLPASDIVTVAAGKRTTHRIEMTCAWQGH
jgi:hypothetical protein